MYSWQRPEWPNFRYRLDGLDDLLYRYAREAGTLKGAIEQLRPGLQDEAAST